MATQAFPIVTLQRKNKSNYFSEYFEQHENDIKKFIECIIKVILIT